MQELLSNLDASHETKVQESFRSGLHIGDHEVIEGRENHDGLVVTVEEGHRTSQLTGSDGLRKLQGTAQKIKMPLSLMVKLLGRLVFGTVLLSLLEGNQNKKICLVSNYYNKFMPSPSRSIKMTLNGV